MHVMAFILLVDVVGKGFFSSEIDTEVFPTKLRGDRIHWYGLILQRRPGRDYALSLSSWLLEAREVQIEGSAVMTRPARFDRIRCDTQAEKH